MPWPSSICDRTHTGQSPDLSQPLASPNIPGPSQNAEDSTPTGRTLTDEKVGGTNGKVLFSAPGVPCHLSREFPHDSNLPRQLSWTIQGLLSLLPTSCLLSPDPCFSEAATKALGPDFDFRLFPGKVTVNLTYVISSHPYKNYQRVIVTQSYTPENGGKRKPLTQVLNGKLERKGKIKLKQAKGTIPFLCVSIFCGSLVL